MSTKKEKQPVNYSVSKETLAEWRRLLKFHQVHLTAARNSREPLKAEKHEGAVEVLERMIGEVEKETIKKIERGSR